MPTVKAITIEFRRDCLCLHLPPEAGKGEMIRYLAGDKLSGVPDAYVRWRSKVPREVFDLLLAGDWLVIGIPYGAVRIL